MSIYGFCEVTLQVTDPAAAALFYQRAFGLREIDRQADRVWLAVGSKARLGLWSPGRKEHGDRGGEHVHFAFSVSGETMDELAERVRCAGGDAKGPHEHDGGDRSLYVTDPAGNVVEAWNFFESGQTVDDLISDKSGVGA